MSETGNQSGPPWGYKWIWGWLLCLILGFCTPLLLVSILWFNGICTCGIGSRDTLAEPTFIGVGLSIALWLVLEIVALVSWAVHRRGWRFAVIMLLNGLGGFLSLFPALVLGRYLKLVAASVLAERSQPVVAAIESFVSDKGRPPRELPELVPEYLPTSPTTGSSLYPDYILTTGAEAQSWNNPWVLEIDMFEILKWDALYYCPRHNCTELPGGATIPVGAWVFLDE